MNILNFCKEQGITYSNFVFYVKYKICKIWVKKQLSLLGSNYDFTKKNDFFLKNMLKYASRNVPFYKRNHFQNFKDYPIIGKEDIRGRENIFCSVKKNRLVYQKLNTGGSTGEPFGFLISPQFDDVFQEFLWKLNGYQDGDIILMLAGGKISREKRDKHIYWEKAFSKQLPCGGYRMSSIYLNQNTCQYYYKYLTELQPAFIRGYVSAVYMLALWMSENEVSLPYNLKGIELTSESIFEYQITLIEKTFQTKVFLQYGHTEACVFGYSYDKSHRYKCAPLYGKVEVLDSDGNQVNEGEIGEVVVTSYTNYVQPFIRYRTGDLAEYGGEKNGVVILNTIYGRTQDYIYNHKKEKVLLTAIIFGGHYGAFDHIAKWQIVQEEYGKVLFCIIRAHNYSQKDEMEIRTVFDQSGIETEFVYVEDLPLTGRGKSKLLVQRIEES